MCGRWWSPLPKAAARAASNHPGSAARRRALAVRLGHVQQVLAGSLTEQARRCGKSSCRCADRRAARLVRLLQVPQAENAGNPPSAEWNPALAIGTALSPRTPLDNQSGKRTGRARSKKGNRYLAGITGETAVAAGKSQTREGACPGTRYQDLGPDYYDRQASTLRPARSSTRATARCHELSWTNLPLGLVRSAAEGHPKSRCGQASRDSQPH